MSEHAHNAQFPKLPLYSAAFLIGATLLLVAGVRMTGIGDVRTPQAAVTAERMLSFTDQQDGSIAVRDAQSGELVEQLAPGTNGFLRGTMRGLARERKRESIGPDAAFRLTARSDGRLLLQDPATGRLIDLGAFGPTNAAVFARLLTEATQNGGHTASTLSSATDIQHPQLAASQK
jgi:putative photosynthetic complex assembly protein